MSDYRCTPYCPPFHNIPEKKRTLLEEIRKTHKRAKDIYRIVKARENDAHKGFFALYNDKCAYCGCSVDILSAQLFEVDHLKPKSDKETPSEELNALDNLVLSCRNCNNGKSDYWFQELSEEWSPDGCGIAEIFNRDNQFNIVVASSYKADTRVKELFKELKMGEQYRRLDYLLMSMKGYIKTLPLDSDKRRLLIDIFCELLEKRNRVGI